MDVEGSYLEIIKGGLELIKKCRPIALANWLAISDG